MTQNTSHRMGIKEWICLGIIGFATFLLAISSAVFLTRNFSTGRLIAILILFALIILSVLTLFFAKIYMLKISGKVPDFISDHPIILSIIEIFSGLIVFLIIEGRNVEKTLNFDTLFVFSPMVIGLCVLVALIPNIKERRYFKNYRAKVKQEKEEDKQKSIAYNNANSAAIQSFADAFELKNDALPVLRSCFGGGGRRLEEKYSGTYEQKKFSLTEEGFLKILDIICKTHDFAWENARFTSAKGEQTFDRTDMTCTLTLTIFIGIPANVGYHDRVLSKKIEDAAREATYDKYEKEAIVRQLRADYRQELMDAKRADMEIYKRRFAEVCSVANALFDNVNLFFTNGTDVFKVFKIYLKDSN